MKLFKYGLLFCLSGAVIFVVVTGTWIGRDVNKTVQKAKLYHPGDDIEALLAFVESSGHSLPARNRAVWTLGQLGDNRALETLKKLYTGAGCDHEKYLCQYELKKAITLCEGKLNITAFLWRK